LYKQQAKTNGVIRMQTQVMTVKEFMTKDNHISEKEIQQYNTLSLTIKVALIVTTALIPLHLNELLEVANGALQPSLEAYVNQFTPSQIIDVVLKGVK
jgi:hypothetical protein